VIGWQAHSPEQIFRWRALSQELQFKSFVASTTQVPLQSVWFSAHTPHPEIDADLARTKAPGYRSNSKQSQLSAPSLWPV
jgi:hypothetical protein